MMLDIRVLGPVRAHADGSECPLGGLKQRALLARLALAHGRHLSADRLIDELWEEDLPRDPGHALQARISRLRAALPVDIDLLSGGYRLDPTGVHIDSFQFELLCDHARWLISDGDLNRAAECLHDALELWQGTALEDLDLFEIPALRSEAMRLENLRDTAQADYIDVHLALGNYTSIIPELHSLVAQDPLSPRHWGQMMTALYCDGRSDEALEAFARARETFVEYMNVEPSGELAGLRSAILSGERPESLLRWPPTGSMVEGPDCNGARPGAESLVAVTSNQPNSLGARVRNGETLILTGPAGIGKTHLLRAIGATFEARRCSAPLLSASALSRGVPLGVFAGQAGIGSGERSSPTALIDFFTRRRSMTVLLVDNVDHLDEASLFVVTHLIRTSRVPAILTSRDLTSAPAEIRALYDSGELSEVEMHGLSDVEAQEAITQMLDGSLTPDALPRLLEASGGNPLHLREVITGSLDDGRLVQTSHGWELQGAPAATPRLAQLVGESFSALDESSLEAAASVAIAGEYPANAIGQAERRALARSGLLTLADNGWVQLADPLHGEFLRTHFSDVLWHELTREAVKVLRSDVAATRPEARRRARILALDLDDPIDVEETLVLAEQALGAFDERLALRAAEAVIAHSPLDGRAYRIAGLAASALGDVEASDGYFEMAHLHAASAEEGTALALAQAEHLGLRHHDAAGALALVQGALSDIDGPDEVAHLERASMRWAVVAGYGGEAISAPEKIADAATAFGLITVGMSGVISGPLEEAVRVLVRLRQVPDDIIEMVPGGAPLIELTEIMALSNSGDVVSSRRRLRERIAEAVTVDPETLGMWEYALGFSELFSGDAEQARRLGESASKHLEWRDTAGLLPAARALTGAAARATGRSAESRELFDAVPEPAAGDPKVVMLRGWTEAWQAHTDGRADDAGRTLVDAAQWLLTAQHTYFAGMLAHCAVRAGRCIPEAIDVLRHAGSIAGGGLLDLFARHGEATIEDDRLALDLIAREARELGMATTAVDTWMSLARSSPEDGPTIAPDSQLQRASVEQLRSEVPAMVLWAEQFED
ncbi:MAG: BTAD domain-containing putative transcriptional regulator [Microthrixaceae bacterium]